MTLGVGVLGFGVMGRVHAAAWVAARAAGLPVEVVGIHSRSLGGGDAAGNLEELAAELPFDVAGLTRFPTVDDLLGDARIGAVSICTHTDSHVPLALRALAAGHHVLVEKPVALTAAKVEPLAEAAGLSAALCMPGFCMRFWPGWPWLRERIHDGSLGEVRSASFERLGPPPGWAGHFYGDLERSGGALHDMHVHDADFVRWCFGDPQTIQASGDLRRVEAMYGYAHVAEPVRATGGWVEAPGFEFRMRYRIEFAEGVADFAHDRATPLRLVRNGEAGEVEVPDESAYDAEIRHFAQAVLEGEPLRASMEDALAVARLLDREKSALAS